MGRAGLRLCGLRFLAREWPLGGLRKSLAGAVVWFNRRTLPDDNTGATRPIQVVELAELGDVLLVGGAYG